MRPSSPEEGVGSSGGEEGGREREDNRPAPANLRSFPAEILALYEPLRRRGYNYGPLHGTDGREPVYWRLLCGCCIHLSPHGVSDSRRDAAAAELHAQGLPATRQSYKRRRYSPPRRKRGPGRPCKAPPAAPGPAPLPPCFECRFHPSKRSTNTSKWQKGGFALLCDMVAGMECVIVWEARPLGGRKAYDFMLMGPLAPFEGKEGAREPAWRVLVEVDGRQHSTSPCHGEEASSQIARDELWNTRAVEKGWHVVRLDKSDALFWRQTVAVALEEAQSGKGARVHRSSSAAHPS